MKHPEYDSPFELITNDITARIARNIDEMSLQAVQRVGVNVDKDKLLTALKQDAERYREAYKNGYETGYEKRDDDIVRCKDCDNKECWGRAGDVVCGIDGTPHRPDWFCADGERMDRRDGNEGRTAAAAGMVDGGDPGHHSQGNERGREAAGPGTEEV